MSDARRSSQVAETNTSGGIAKFRIDEPDGYCLLVGDTEQR
jgi:hypothetical protein